MPAEQVNIKASLSFEPVPCGKCSADAYGISGLFESSTYQRALTSGSYRPVYDWCLATEHTRIAQAHQACMAVYRIARLPCELVNLTLDGFIFRRPRKSTTAEKIKSLVESLSIGDLPRLEDKVRDRLLQPEPKQKRLKTTDLFPISGREASDQVFRVLTPQARQHLRGEHRIENVTKNHVIHEPTRCWADLDTAAAEKHVRSGGSLLVTGLAGTGKSTWIRAQIAALKADGKTVVVIAKTHNAAMVAGGDTADHFVWRHVREGATGANTIWVDEVSMLDIGLLQDLNHASYREPPIQWILSGDFNQYEPFFNTFMGVPVSRSLNGSALLHSLSGGSRLTLTECRRSDGELFDWYSSLVAEPPGARHTAPIAENAAQARARFTEDRAVGFIPGTRLAPANLVISHKSRVVLNRLCNEAEVAGHPNAELFSMEEFGLEPLPGTNNPQDAWFWPGQRVVACSKGRKLRNGLEYEILELGTRVTVKATGEEPVSLKRAEFFRCMRLHYAVTYASAQGLTIRTLLALHNTEHKHFDWRKLYVGLSRATAVDKVVVY
jgi:hypothetical protein